MANPSQLFLLADHIKLSLLERQRAIALKLEPNAQGAEISRSLDALKEGVERLESSQNPTAELESQTSRLRRQYDELSSQYHGNIHQATATFTQPNNASLASDFSKAQSSRPAHRSTSSSSSIKRQSGSGNPSKSVRFTDNPNATVDEDPNRSALLPYKDDPEDGETPDHGQLDNQQIHEYHSQVMRDQDEQLDSLGRSIGRQRELSIQIGDELDDQVRILDDVERDVDRHQTQLDRARTRVGNIMRKAKDNMQLTIILILIIILILLIIVLR